MSTTFDSSDFRNIVPRFTREARNANLALVDLLRKVAERKKKATPAQIAFAWLLAYKPWIVLIPGTRKLQRLEQNIGAVAVELTSEDLREIDRPLQRSQSKERDTQEPGEKGRSLSELHGTQGYYSLSIGEYPRLSLVSGPVGSTILSNSHPHLLAIR